MYLKLIRPRRLHYGISTSGWRFEYREWASLIHNNYGKSNRFGRYIKVLNTIIPTLDYNHDRDRTTRLSGTVVRGLGEY